jgi:pimeloyl-ACP methyl ester carboxylesterase
MDKALARCGIVEKRVGLGGVNLNVAIGPDNGPPLVLLPGQTQPWESYTKVLPALSRRFFVHAVDIRGHGKSEWTRGAYTFENLGRDVERLIDEVVGRPAIVTGNSSGGVIAVWVAANAPKSVVGVVPEDPPLFTCEWPRIKGSYVFGVLELAVETLARPEGRNVAAFLARLEIPSRGGVKIANVPRPLVAAIAAALRATRWLHGDGPVDAKVLPFRARMIVRGFSEYDPEFSRAFLDGSAGVDFDHADALRRVRCPMLLIHANWFIHPTHGLVGAMSDTDAARVRDLVDDVRYLPIPTGHIVHQESPRRFVAEVEKFAREIGALPAAGR